MQHPQVRGALLRNSQFVHIRVTDPRTGHSLLVYLPTPIDLLAKQNLSVYPTGWISVACWLVVCGGCLLPRAVPSDG